MPTTNSVAPSSSAFAIIGATGIFFPLRRSTKPAGDAEMPSSSLTARPKRFSPTSTAKMRPVMQSPVPSPKSQVPTSSAFRHRLEELLVGLGVCHVTKQEWHHLFLRHAAEERAQQERAIHFFL